jgi:hypothetical protein
MFKLSKQTANTRDRVIVHSNGSISMNLDHPETRKRILQQVEAARKFQLSQSEKPAEQTEQTRDKR